MPGRTPKKKIARSKEERSDRMVAKKAEAKAGPMDVKEVSKMPASKAGMPIKVTFKNAAGVQAALYMVTRSGEEKFMSNLAPGESADKPCIAPTDWKIVIGGKTMQVVANRDKAVIEISADQILVS